MGDNSSHDSYPKFGPDQVIVSNEPIPNNRMRQFHEILCANGGYYRSTPKDYGDVMRVDYVLTDMVAHQAAWARCINDIKEVRKDQWWRVMWRKFKTSVSQ